MNHIVVIYITTIFLLFTACDKKKSFTEVEFDQISDKTTYESPVEIDLSEHLNAGYRVYINDSNIQSSDLILNDAGFYELELKKKNLYKSKVFVVIDPERGEAEWSLTAWTPAQFSESELGTAQIKAVYPSPFVAGVRMPVVLKTMQNNLIDPNYHFVDCNDQSKLFNIKRGIGSANLLVQPTDLQFSFIIDDNEKVILLHHGGLNPYELEHTISSNKGINSFSLITITSDLEIQQGYTLTIHEGCVLLVDEGVNIVNYGNIKFLGTTQNPVVVTCSEPDQLWGGFISTGVENALTVTNTMFVQSGYHTSIAYQYGHARRQALFFLENSEFYIDSSYIIDNKGQIFYSNNANLEINHCLIQRAKTGGEINFSNITINHSIFTDFPNDNQVYLDDDNDGLYINASDAEISNSTFMYAKDDGIDSGASEGGSVNFTNCHFEAIFHEGTALSSASPVVKIHTITNCTYTNCGQGVELGYSSSNHTVWVDSCNFYYNNIGIRYGDNYPWSVAGTMHVSNSVATDNEIDIWNMVREDWEPYVDNLKFVNTKVSKPNAYYPDLIIQ